MSRPRVAAVVSVYGPTRTPMSSSASCWRAMSSMGQPCELALEGRLALHRSGPGRRNEPGRRHAAWRPDLRDDPRRAHARRRALAVDGVLLIGEHGDYPTTPWEQPIYPRRRFFEEAIAVMRASGRVVPIFTDKHLSYDWPQARWMFDTAAELGIPLLAGSSLPVAQRAAAGAADRRAVVEAVQSVTGRSRSTASTRWRRCSAWSSAARAARRASPPSNTSPAPPPGPPRLTAGRRGCWRRRWRRASASSRATRPPTPPTHPSSCWSIRDGLRAAVLLLNGHLEDFGVALRVAGAAELLATNVRLQRGRPYGHFAGSRARSSI